jgi:integrase
MNEAAYRTVFLGDSEGRKPLRVLKAYVRERFQNPREFLLHNKHGKPLLASNVLKVALHPALKALGLPRTGMHVFRRGCNQRWQLAGMNPAVEQNMMGHSSPAMTDLYWGKFPLSRFVLIFLGGLVPKL